MSDLYNLTGLTNAQNLADIMVVANDATKGATGYATMFPNGLLFTGMVFVFFFIQVMFYRRYNLTDGVLTASTTSFIVSVFLAIAQLVSLYTVVVFLVIMVLSALYVKSQKD